MKWRSGKGGGMPKQMRGNGGNVMPHHFSQIINPNDELLFDEIITN